MIITKSFQLLMIVILGWIYYVGQDVNAVFKVGLLLLAVYYISPMFLPGSWKWPGWDALNNNMWNTSPGAKLFPPKKWGYGWTINFAYPLIPSKPLLNRLFGLLICGGMVYSISIIIQLLYIISTGVPITPDLFPTWFP